MLEKSHVLTSSPNQPQRGRFWQYCKRAHSGSWHRAKQLGIPHNIDAYDIDELLTDQGFRCAVSGIALTATVKGPFSPSLDRIVPARGYIKGNLRVVCQIVNFAMNEWGLEPLERLVEAMSMMKV